MNQKGFTLIELVVVLALIALIMLGVVIGISSARKAGVARDIESRIRTIETGLYEYKTYKGILPSTTTMELLDNIVALRAYVPDEIRSSWGYQCDRTTNQVTVLTPAISSSDEATDVSARLVDKDICSSTSLIPGSNQISCVLKQFNGTAQCNP